MTAPLSLSDRAKAYADKELKRRIPTPLRKSVRGIPAIAMMVLWIAWFFVRLPFYAMVDRLVPCADWVDYMDNQTGSKLYSWEEWCERPY